MIQTSNKGDEQVLHDLEIRSNLSKATIPQRRNIAKPYKRTHIRFYMTCKQRYLILAEAFTKRVEVFKMETMAVHNSNQAEGNIRPVCVATIVIK